MISRYPWAVRWRYKGQLAWYTYGYCSTIPEGQDVARWIMSMDTGREVRIEWVAR